MTQREQEILFNATQKINIMNPEQIYAFSPDYLKALSLNKEISRYGYTFSLNAINQIAMLSDKSLSELKSQVINILDDKVGLTDFATSEPFYKNFPEEVMSKSDGELYFNALMYYTFGQTNDPEMTEVANQIRAYVTDTEVIERDPLPESEFNKLHVINAAFDGELEDVLYKRTQSMNMSEEMYQEMKDYASLHENWLNRIYKSRSIDCPSHETKAKLTMIAYNQKDPIATSMLCNHAEDVLRFACLLSKENNPEWTYLNANLEFNTKNNKKIFKFTKNQQREIKNLLNNCEDLYTSIWHREDLFTRLKERINANDIKYPRVKEAFTNLSKGNMVNEFGEKIESLNPNYVREELKRGNIEIITTYAKSNPKLFIRNIVSFAEIPQKGFEEERKKERIIREAIVSTTKDVPIIQLLHLKNYLVNTMDKKERPYNVSKVKEKTFIIPNKMYLSEMGRDNLITSIDQVIRTKAKVLYENAFVNKSVYIDRELSNRKAPERSIRNASKGQTLVPYSKIKGNPEKNIAAFGIFWKNQDNERADIDLSVKLLAQNGDIIDNIYYGNLKGKAQIGVHSGDYTSGVISSEINGAEEFVFLDKSLLKAHNVKYAIATVHGFNVPFCDADSVRFMMEEKSGSLSDASSQRNPDSVDKAPSFKGKLMDPREIKYAYRLTQDATMATSCIYDVEKDTYISLDSTEDIGYGQNIEGFNSSLYTNVEVYKATHSDVANMRQLFESIALSTSCEFAERIEDADIIFAAEPIDAIKTGIKPSAKIITSYELDRISSDFCDRKEEFSFQNSEEPEETLDEELEADLEEIEY